MNQLIGRFIILIGHLVAPHAVHRFAGLEWQTSNGLSAQSRFVFSGYVTFEKLQVLSFVRVLMMVVTHQASRLQTVDERILFGQLPVESRLRLIVIPPPIEPNSAYGAILSQQFSELPIHKGKIMWPIGFRRIFSHAAPGSSHGIIVAHPVDVAIIKMECQTILSTRLGQLCHHVLTVGRVHDVVVALPRVPHRKAVVVARSEGDVARTGLFENLGPGFGIERVRIERVGRLGILFSAKRPVLQIPFSLCKSGIDAPMNEDAESIFRKLATTL